MALTSVVDRSFATALTALALALGMQPAAAEPVAVVTDVQGGATLISGAASALGILSPLSAGDRVRLVAGARMAMLYYADGAQFDVRGPGTLELTASRPQASEGAVVEARRAEGASAVRLKSGGLVQGAVVMRGRGLRVMAPDALVLTTHPDLAWTDSRSEATYDVALTDAAGRRVFEASTAARTLAVPDSVGLLPGQAYALQVSARVAGAQVQTARAEFSVAPEELQAQARALAPKSADAPVAERVAYALWLEDNDLRDDARKWWAGVAQARPEESGLRQRAGIR
jgi:hypothetical protein